MIQGVSITDLKRIPNPKGDVYHALKVSDSSFESFGEVYFTEVNYQEVKGWKQHTHMVMNLVVPVGEVKLYLKNNQGESYSVVIGTSNYQRICIQPGVWMAFEGVGESQNLMMNMASIEHDPTEYINKDLSEFELV